MTQQKAKLILTLEDKNSQLWRKLMAHWEDRIESLRNQNDASQDIVETEKLRGRIAEIKANLALDKDPLGIEL